MSQSYEQHEQLTLRAQSLEEAQALLAQEFRTHRASSSVLPCLDEGLEDAAVLHLAQKVNGNLCLSRPCFLRILCFRAARMDTSGTCLCSRGLQGCALLAEDPA